MSRRRGDPVDRTSLFPGLATNFAENLESRVVVVDVSGPSRVVVNASEELRGRVDAPGSVEYIGDPTVDVDGLGAVHKR